MQSQQKNDQRQATTTTTLRHVDEAEAEYANDGALVRVDCELPQRQTKRVEEQLRQRVDGALTNVW